MKPPTARLPLVLLHGLLSTPLEFGLIQASLRARGVPLITPEIQGYTAGDRRRRRSWQAWRDAAAQAITQAVPAGQRFVLGGLCAGGLLAAALALDGLPGVDGLALLSPTFEYDGWGLTRWARLRKLGYALGLERVINVPEREPFGIKNEKIRGWVMREMRTRAESAAGPSSLPLWSIHEVERLSAAVRQRLGELQARTLVLHAREDELSSLATVERGLREMRAIRPQLVVLDDSYHMITIDNDRHRVVSELVAFTHPLAGAAAPAAVFEPAPHTAPPALAALESA